MEKENNKQLAFLDVLVTRLDNLKLGHKVYRKTTHTDRYLHKNSNHHPSQKRGVIKSLFDRATRICEPQYLEEELQHINTALQANGYSSSEINRVLHPRRSGPKEEIRSVSTTYLPYIKNV